MKRFKLLLFALLTGLAAVNAQDKQPAKWDFSIQKIADKTFEIHAKATLENGYRIYSVKENESLPIATEITLEGKAAKKEGEAKEVGTIIKKADSNFDKEMQYYEQSYELVQTVKVDAADATELKGTLSYFAATTTSADPFEQTFTVKADPAAAVTTAAPATPVATADTAKATTVQPVAAEDDASDKSLAWIFITCFLGGFLAVLTPCVFSVIPITVSFFTKRSKTRAEGLKNAALYSFSIIFIFTLLGFIITKVFGASALNELSSNIIANLLFCVIFITFGLSFLGAFEIQLPSSWANKADTKAGLGSYSGIFFMALTLVIVSFSCTGPIIGNLLVLAAKGGNSGPLIGMFGFSLALAIPFFLFALFPNLLQKAKPGGWMNTVKVQLGLLELALALKFLSNVDMAYHWNLLDREIFLAIWIVIFSLMGLNLLGKVLTSHDSDLPRVSIPRLLLSIVIFTFVVYMIPGMWGAPLKGISGFLPHEGSQDFNIHNKLISIENKLQGGTVSIGGSNSNVKKPSKYTDILHSEIPGVEDLYFDYDEAMEAAKAANKPLMIDFTGHSCVNCRKFEKSVLSDPRVMKIMREDFIVVSLYTDEKTALPENEQYVSTLSGAKIKSVGNKNFDFQAIKFNRNSQPYYIPVDHKGDQLTTTGYGYDPKENKEEFIAYLEKAKAEFAKRNGK
ncbi:thiol:disulfide interchange protein DsbD [Chitinophaga skermanii]|uniref:Thiol:disulfide interchange protein DsbD n=1 Tax=Chitinophaga skermanii TaxID=331697 RepID=A0A327QJP9_9BACT|nr:thioredoxin family protein [Chitinophaga skermanii]RAJ04228.1 thiol:disulfide interchange protein DsbD [Chitinophaga skermanii]